MTGSDWTSARDPKRYTDAMTTFAPLPPGARRIWFVYFALNETDLDRRVVDHWRIAAQPVSSLQRKYHAATLWQVTDGEQSKVRSSP
jgi:hypothetical protein